MAQKVGSASGSKPLAQGPAIGGPTLNPVALFGQVFGGDPVQARRFWSGVLANVVSGAASLILPEDTDEGPEVVDKELLQTRLYIVHRISGMLS
jgi:hypothetical protein